MALAREKTALALARMEKQFFLALAYFVRKRLTKRLLLAFQIGKKMSNVQNTLIFLFFSSFSFSFSFLFPFSLLIRSAFPSFPLLSPYPIGLSFLLSLLGGVQATTRAPTSVLSAGASGVCAAAAAGAPPAPPSSAMDAASARAVKLRNGRGLGTPPRSNMAAASAHRRAPLRLLSFGPAVGSARAAGCHGVRRPPPPLLLSSQACLMVNVVLSVK